MSCAVQVMGFGGKLVKKSNATDAFKAHISQETVNPYKAWVCGAVTHMFTSTSDGNQVKAGNRFLNYIKY